MTLDCLIIDDEQLARDMLESYLDRIAQIKVLAKCKSPEEAIPLLGENKIDVLLLDIQMPGISGVDFLKQLIEPPAIIFTTAYSKYAIESYELEVIDYLLKPIGFERFQMAIEKAKKRINGLQIVESLESKSQFEREIIQVQEGYNRHKIFLKDIRYIKAMREYVTYFLRDGKIMELKSLSQLEIDLPAAHFVRIHRSYIVSKSVVRSHHNNKLTLDDKTVLPIGKTYKQRILYKIF